MKILKKMKKISNDEKGIALILTIGILTLMLLMALTFAAVTKNSHSVAAIYDDMTRARLLAESGMARCLGYMKAMEKNETPMNTFYSGMDADADYNGDGSIEPNDIAHDYVRMTWMMGRFESDTQIKIDPANYPLAFEDVVVDSALIGRIAYVITKGGGLLDPSFCVEYDIAGVDSNIANGRTTCRAESAGTVNDTMRFGRFVSDIDLKNVLTSTGAGNIPQGNAHIDRGKSYTDETAFWAHAGITVSTPPSDSQNCFYIGGKSSENFKNGKVILPRFNLRSQMPVLPSNISNVASSYTDDDDQLEKIINGIPWIKNWKAPGGYQNNVSYEFIQKFIAANIIDYLDADSYRTVIGTSDLLDDLDSTYWKHPDSNDASKKNRLGKKCISNLNRKKLYCLGFEKEAYYINEIEAAFTIEQTFDLSDHTTDTYILTALEPELYFSGLKAELINFGSTAKSDQPFLYAGFGYLRAGANSKFYIKGEATGFSADFSPNEIRFGDAFSYDSVSDSIQFTSGVGLGYTTKSSPLSIPLTRNESTHSEQKFNSLTSAEVLKTTTGEHTLTYFFGDDNEIGALLFDNDGNSNTQHLMDVFMKNRSTSSALREIKFILKEDALTNYISAGGNDDGTFVFTIKIIWYMHGHANDPRCDDNQADKETHASSDVTYEFNNDDTDGTTIADIADDGEDEEEDPNSHATLLPGAKNNLCDINTECDGIKADNELLTAEPWELSTNFSRNGPMESLWELGTIHRGVSWQTLNIDKFNNTGVLGGSAYADGDANILDQVKLTDKSSTYGLVSVNIRDDVNSNATQVYKALFSGLTIGTGYDGSGYSASAPADSMISQTEALSMAATIIHPTTGVNPDGDYLTRTELITDWGTICPTSIVNPKNDAEEEEIIGKFINLTSTLAPTLALSVYAQSIRKSGVPITKNNKFGYDYLLMDNAGVSESVTTIDLNIYSGSGGGTVPINFNDSPTKFNFSDDIIGEEQISAELGWSETDSKWHIKSYRIITP